MGPEVLVELVWEPVTTRALAFRSRSQGSLDAIGGEGAIGVRTHTCCLGLLVQGAIQNLEQVILRPVVHRGRMEQARGKGAVEEISYETVSTSNTSRCV
jgi:hypothetical protein